jgi:CheY-like chemotaxis protein
VRHRVLFANADVVVADQFRAYFSTAGYSVETASDGLDCLSKLRRMVPDLLVLDRDLARGGSDGVLACLRDEQDVPRVPVVVIATALPIGTLSQLLRPPVVRCLQKPFCMAALRDCLDSAIVCAVVKPAVLT